MDPTHIASAFVGAGIEGEMIDPSHVDYDRRRRVWNGVADRRPALILRAKTVGDVVKTVRLAAARGVLLAVRGGGHSLPGLSTCDGGIVLDLSLLNAVSVDPLTRIAEVSGGALLGDVDAAGAPFDLFVPAGVISHTGAGGLTLGGGMGWLSRRFGLTIDSLLAADIVTADGQLRTVNANAEPDLFWAIRGGGGNFGVVTKFYFRMHHIGSVWAGEWTYPAREAAHILPQFRQLAASASRNLTTSFNLTASSLSMTAFWSGPIEGAAATIAPFGKFSSEVSGRYGQTTFPDQQRRHDDIVSWGRRYYAKGGFISDIDDRVVTSLLTATASSPSPECEIYILQLGGAISDIGDDATAYTGRAAGYYWIAQPIWDDPAIDDKCFAWGRKAAAQLTEISLAGNYVNEQADASSDIAKKAYGASKYGRLSSIKKRFDPGNLFRLNQNILPG